jgi:hypothetical protein
VLVITREPMMARRLAALLVLLALAYGLVYLYLLSPLLRGMVPLCGRN